MNKKGFTLIELLGVIIILSALGLLIIPNIVNRFSSKKENISKVNTALILDAAKLYVDEHQDIYIQENNAKYCISIDAITDAGYLDSSIKEVKNSEDVIKNKKVKVTFNKKFEYELVDNEDC